VAASSAGGYVSGTQRAANLLLRHGLRTAITNPTVQQRWRDFEPYMADSFKVAPR
jgi:hypothetical protein